MWGSCEQRPHVTRLTACLGRWSCHSPSFPIQVNALTLPKSYKVSGRGGTHGWSWAANEMGIQGPNRKIPPTCHSYPLFVYGFGQLMTSCKALVDSYWQVSSTQESFWSAANGLWALEPWRPGFKFDPGSTRYKLFDLFEPQPPQMSNDLDLL